MNNPDTISADYTLRPRELAATLALLVEARQPAIVWGPPGSTKSQIAQQVAADAGHEYVDVRAPLLDPVDLRDIPWRDGANRTRWAPPAFADTDSHVIETAMARVVMACALKHHTRRGERVPGAVEDTVRGAHASTLDWCALSNPPSGASACASPADHSRSVPLDALPQDGARRSDSPRPEASGSMRTDPLAPHAS